MTPKRFNEPLCVCVQALTSATLAGLSDIVAQRIVSRGALNWRRTAAIAVRRSCS